MLWVLQNGYQGRESKAFMKTKPIIYIPLLPQTLQELKTCIPAAVEAMTHARTLNCLDVCCVTNSTHVKNYLDANFKCAFSSVLCFIALWYMCNKFIKWHPSLLIALHNHTNTSLKNVAEVRSVHDEINGRLCFKNVCCQFRIFYLPVFYLRTQTV